MKSISNIFAIFFSCMLGLTSQTEAQEEQSQQPDAQQQEEEKDIPVITNPAVFNEKDLDKLLEKQREYIKKHYPDYRIRGKGEEHDVMDGRHYSEFYLQNEDEEWVLTIRFDIEEAYQAYMKKHQKEIEREAARLIREGLIKIE